MTCRLCQAPSDGVLCSEHWYRLPWSLRNAATCGWRIPTAATRGWMRDAMGALGSPVRTVKASEPLTLTERRLRPQALRVVQSVAKPVKASDCADDNPCYKASCKWHLYLDVERDGTIRFNFPGKEIWELEETCYLRLLKRGPLPAEESARLMGLSRTEVWKTLRGVAEAHPELEASLRATLEARL